MPVAPDCLPALLFVPIDSSSVCDPCILEVRCVAVFCANNYLVNLMMLGASDMPANYIYYLVFISIFGSSFDRNFYPCSKLLENAYVRTVGSNEFWSWHVII